MKMLWKHLRNKMLEHPLQIISDGNQQITYIEAISFVEKFSKELKGIQCCTILLKSELSVALATLSCFAAGVTAVPLSYRYGELHCNKIFDLISPDALITDKNNKFEMVRLKNSKYSYPNEKPAIIMCTSGTTGVPKGVMLTENNIITNMNDICTYFNISDRDTILISRPLYHCAVLTGEFLTALVKGVKIYFYSEQFNPTVILKIMKDYFVTAFCGTPTMLSMIARFKRSSDDDCLKYICISGECMDVETGKRIRNKFPNSVIYNIYGLTEACPRITYLPPELFDNYSDFVGIPLNSVEIKVLLEDGSEASPNQVGVLWVKGGNVMIGYYNNPQKTAEVLKNGWLCTGDLALINSKGLLKIKGRNDDMIIKAGMNIYPQEIESALKIDDRVKEVVVFAENDEHLGIQLILNIVGDFVNAKEVKKMCQGCLPGYQIPTKINLVYELPKNGSGKLVRK